MIDQKSDSVSDNELECPYCQKQIDDFECHIKGAVNDGETFSCNNCDLVISNDQCLSSHKQIVHRDAMKVFSCETCNIDFSSKKYLFVHKDIDHQQRNVGKKQNGGYTEDFVVKVEIKEEEKDDTLFENISNSYEVTQSFKQEYKCDQCQKSFPYPQKLSTHVSVVHNGEKNFECTECGKKFGYKWNMNKHLHNVHGKIGKNVILDNYTCDICDKTFKYKDILKEHQRCVHYNARPFEYAECPMAFKMEKHVKKHVKQVHLDIRKNPCD